MAQREILLPWDSQPQEVVGPSRDWGPAGLWNFATSVDAVTGRLNTLGASGVAVPSVGSLGIGTKVSGSVFNRCVLNGASGATNIGADDFTVGITFRLDGTGGYSALSRWNSGGSAGTNSWLLGGYNGFASTIGSFSVEVGTTVYAADFGGTSWVSGETYSLFGRRAGTTIYVDRYTHSTGVWHSASNTNAGITTVNDIAARNFKIGEIDASAALNASLTPYVAATFKRGLSDGALREWVANPWPLFAPRSIWVPVSAAGGGPTYTLTADAGAITLAGAAAALKVSRSLVAGAGSLVLTGNAAALTAQRKLSAGAGELALTGNAAALSAQRKLSAAAGSLALTGAAADLVYAPVGGPTHTLTASAGVLTLTGSSAVLAAQRKLLAGAGSLALTGADATLTYTQRVLTLIAEAGSFALTGGDATLTYSGGTAVDSGDGGDGGSSKKRRYTYVKRGKKFLLFDTPADADEFLEAEAAVEAQAAKPARKKFRKVKPLPVATYEIDAEALKPLLSHYTPTLDVDALIRAQDFEQLLQAKARALRAQDDDEAELLMLTI